MQNDVLGNGCSTSIDGSDYYWDLAQEGIVRAHADGSGVELIASQGYEDSWLTNICSVKHGDKSYIFYAEQRMGEPGYWIYRMSPDGSNRQIIYEDEGTYYINGAAAYGERLYLTEYLVESSDWSIEEYRVVSVDFDGENEVREFEAPCSDYSDSRHRMYVWTGPSGVYFVRQEDNALRYQEYGASSDERIAKPPLEDGYFVSVVQHEGRLLCSLVDENYESGELWSLSLDGDGAKKLFDVPADCDLVPRALAKGRAYYRCHEDEGIVEYSDADTKSMVGISLAGGTREVAIDVECKSGLPVLSNTGSRFVIVESAKRGPGAAYAARSTSYDGENAVRYLEYPYNGVNGSGEWLVPDDDIGNPYALDGGEYSVEETSTGLVICGIERFTWDNSDWSWGSMYYLNANCYVGVRKDGYDLEASARYLKNGTQLYDASGNLVYADGEVISADTGEPDGNAFAVGKVLGPDGRAYYLTVTITSLDEARARYQRLSPTLDGKHLAVPRGTAR